MSSEHITALGSVRRLVNEDDGVTAIEYGLLAALIAVTCIVAFQATGGALTAIYTYWVGAVLGAL